MKFYKKFVFNLFVLLIGLGSSVLEAKLTICATTSLVADLVAMGQITAEQAETHPRRHLVTRVIGTPEIVVDEFDLELEPGDRIVICSDGLNSMLRDHEIAAKLDKASSPSEAAWSLVEAANAAGGSDNTTVAVVDVSP